MSKPVTTSHDKKKVALSAAIVDDIPNELKQQCLNTALYQIQRDFTFVGSVLQVMNIQYTWMVPTAGVAFNSDMKRYELYINPKFFCKSLNEKQRMAVLIHEMYHVLNKHLIRVPFMRISDHKRILMNVAGDMAINQNIKDLPKGCSQCPPIEAQQQGQHCPNDLCPGYAIDVADWHDVDEKTQKKTPWPRNKTMEDYFEKLMERYDEPDEPKDGDGDGQGEGSGKGTPRQFDQHDWQANAEESEVLDATEDLVKRAMVKQSMSYDDLPANIKDLLDDIKARRSELNYKALILSAIKRSASGHDRTSTWTRRNRRYGFKAPGSKDGELPKLHIYLDTSGSISVEELTEFMGVVDEFLKVGARKCEVNLFSDTNYYNQKYKLGDRTAFDNLKKNVSMGGTNLESSLKQVMEKKGDLAIFLTDGYYADVGVEQWMKPGQKFPQVLWVISKNGQIDHPLKRLGQNVKIPEGNKK